MHIQFFENGLQMPFDGVGSDDKFLGDLFVGQAFCQRVQHFPLRGRSGRSIHSCDLIGSPGFFNHAAEGVAIKGLFFDIGRDGMFGVDLLNLLRFVHAADNDGGDTFGMCLARS